MNDKKPLIYPGAIEDAVREFDKAMTDHGFRDQMAIAMGVPADLLWPPNPPCPQCGVTSRVQWDEETFQRGDAAPAMARLPIHVCDPCCLRFASEHDVAVRMMVTSLLATGPDEQK
jgi:hypothetical protein